MKTKILFFFISAIALTQLSFGMELVKKLAPIHTIPVKKIFSVESVAFNKKNQNIMYLLLSFQKNNYLAEYNLQTTQTTQYNYPIKKNSHKLKLFTHHTTERLPKILGPYTLHYVNKTVEIWHIASQKHLYTIPHCTPITLITANTSKTKLITAHDGIINIWLLKNPIIFKCGQDKISIENTDTNQNILRQSLTLGNMFTDLGDTDFNNPISLLCIKNRKEFNLLFALMKHVYLNNIQAIETELNQFNIHQLCLLAKQSNYYDIIESINLTFIICKTIADKYEPVQDQPYITLLEHNLKNIIAQYRVTNVIKYIDHHIKPTQSYCATDIPWCRTANYSHDNKKTAVAFYDTIKVWDKETGKHLYTMIGHTKQIYWVEFSSNNTSILSASQDFTIKTWDLSQYAKQELLNNLTIEQADLLVKIHQVIQHTQAYALSIDELKIFNSIGEKAQHYLRHHLPIEKNI